MFLCSLTPVPCAFHLPWQMPIYFDIVLSVGGCGVNFFSWSTFPSMSGDRNWPLLLIEAVFHCGTTLKRLWILWMHALSWAIWREHNNRLFENRIGDFSSVWDSFCFFFCLPAGLKKIVCSPVFVLILCVVIWGRFSSLLRKTSLLEFNEFLFLLLIIKDYRYDNILWFTSKFFLSVNEILLNGKN